MHRLGLVALLAAVTAGCSSGSSAHAQSADSTARVDTAAMNALNRMGGYLRSLKAFEVKANVTTEEVLENGQKVQLASRVEAVASRPNRLRARLSSDRKERLLLYDGKTFTLFAPRQNFYATVPAPGTISELATVLESKYAIDLPFVDLFRWGTSEAQTDAITDAEEIGPSECDGVSCQHFAFRQQGLDWQVWIQNGEYPLPRKLVLTTLTDDARPQHTSIYSWNLAPSFDNTAFAFTPPKDAKKIPLAEVMGGATQTVAKKNGGNNK